MIIFPPLIVFTPLEAITFSSSNRVKSDKPEEKCLQSYSFKVPSSLPCACWNCQLSSWEYGFVWARRLRYSTHSTHSVIQTPSPSCPCCGMIIVLVAILRRLFWFCLIAAQQPAGQVKPLWLVLIVYNMYHTCGAKCTFNYRTVQKSCTFSAHAALVVYVHLQV